MCPRNIKFLRVRRLWHYVIGDIRAPSKIAEESGDKFVEHLEEWNSRNHLLKYDYGIYILFIYMWSPYIYNLNF